MNQKIIADAGTTLFHIASRYLGDATQWTRIAKINNLSDPFLKIIVVLEIPPMNAPGGR